MNPRMAIAITGKNMSKPAFDAVIGDANRAAGAIDATGGRMATAMGGASFQTANLAAQFNDIGVMLASGQSPLLLAIQQGTQINQIFASMKPGEVFNTMKTAALSLISPLSLVTIGTIAAGAALFQYLMTINTDGKASAEVIGEQNDLIRKVAQNWGDAVPALKAYVDQLDRAANTDQLNTATDLMIDRSFASATTQIDDMRASLGAARIDLQAVGATAQEIDALQGSFDTLRGKIADGTANTTDLEAVMDLLSHTTGSGTVPSMLGFGEVLRNLMPVLEQAAARANTLRSERDALMMTGPDPKTFYDQQDFIGEQERLNGLTREQITLEQQMTRVRAEAKSADVALSDAQVQTLAAERVAADERRNRYKQDAAAADKQVSAYKDVIEQLRLEADMIGKSAREQDVMNNIRAAGVDATSEQGRAIRGLTEQIYDQNKALSDSEAAAKAADKAMSGFTGGAKSELLGVVTSLARGWDAAGQAANKALENMTSKAVELASSGIIDMLFGNLFGGSKAVSSSITGSSGGFFPGLTGPSLPSFAGGGDTGSGARSGGLDGQGGFLAMMHPQERVDDLTVSRGSGGGGVSVVRLELGADLEGRILQQSAQQSVQIVSASASHIAEQGANGAGAKLRNGDFDTAMAGRYRVAPAAKVR